MFEYYLLFLFHWVLLVILPVSFLLFAWLLMRWGKKRDFPLSGRLFILAAFSGATVGFRIILDLVSPYLRFQTENNVAASLGYAFGLAWIVVPIIAAITALFATFAGVVTLFLHRRRSSA
jgi:hypothetical protein